MPIQKRRNIPKPASAREPVDEAYRLPGEPLETKLKRLYQELSNAYWEENLTKAKLLEKEASDVRIRIEAGELYEVDH